MPKDIVICCDGTGNEINITLSNVLKLYRVFIRDEGQRVYYHPGVGTIGLQSTWRRIKQETFAVLGLATGAGGVLPDRRVRCKKGMEARFASDAVICLFPPDVLFHISTAPGMYKETEHPSPKALLISALPPNSSTNERTVARPIPELSGRKCSV
jgi:hypothetical protein